MQTLKLASPPNADVSFFEAGGHSIALTELHKRIVERFHGCKVSLLDIFQAPTIGKQTACLASKLGASEQRYFLSKSSSDGGSDPEASTVATSPNNSLDPDDNKFAIVGMAGHFPGSVDIDSL